MANLARLGASHPSTVENNSEHSSLSAFVKLSHLVPAADVQSAALFTSVH